MAKAKTNVRGGSSKPSGGVRAQRNSTPPESGIKVTPGSGISAQRAAETRATLGKHVEGLTGHLLDSATYNNHGHFVGHQTGHRMVDSDTHMQRGEFIPQHALRDAQDSAFAKTPNMASKSGGVPFDSDQAKAADCGVADCPGTGDDE